MRLRPSKANQTHSSTLIGREAALTCYYAMHHSRLVGLSVDPAKAPPGCFYKHLGVFLDRKLTFNLRMRKITNRVTKAL